MKIVAPLSILLLLCLSHLLRAQDGALDLTFSLDGLDIADFNSQTDAAYPAITQPDNKIIIAGYTYSGTSYDFAMLRYNDDGSLDTSFSGDGKLVVDWFGEDDFCNTLALQADGKILVGGSASTGVNTEFAILRLTPKGTPDSSFSSDGMQTTSAGSLGAPLSCLIQPDGKIVLIGYSNNADNDFTLIRYLSNGDPDPSFGLNGLAVTPISTGEDTGISGALQPDGKILVTGYFFDGSDFDLVLARYNSDGTFDSSFNAIGYTITDIGNAGNYGRAVGLVSDKIVVGGYHDSGLNNDFILLQYNSEGVLDTTFSEDGYVLTDISNGDDQAISMTIQPDEKIVLAGYAEAESGNDFALARYLTDGSLDTSFGAGGIAITDFNGTNDYGFIVSQGDQRLTLTGYTLSTDGPDFATASYVCAVCEVQDNFPTVIYSSAGDENSAFLFPNPATDKAQLQFITGSNIVSIELFDQSGRRISSVMKNERLNAGKHSVELEVSYLRTGMYHLVLTDSQQVQTIKFLKEH